MRLISRRTESENQEAFTSGDLFVFSVMFLSRFRYNKGDPQLRARDVFETRTPEPFQETGLLLQRCRELLLRKGQVQEAKPETIANFPQ